MKEEDLKIARALKGGLSKVIDIVDLRVFGSRVKGQADEYSDMDVFIEIKTMGKKTEGLINNIVWEVGIENSIYISPLIFTRYEIEESPLKESPIVKNIEEERIRI